MKCNVVNIKIIFLVRCKESLNNYTVEENRFAAGLLGGAGIVPSPNK